jgi:hypothetical protein
MVSLKERERSEILAGLGRRFSKIPLILDPGDLDMHLERAVRKLDELLFNPRSIIFNNASDGLVDVTALNIDVITAVYYSTESADSLLGGMDLGVGILPMISSQMMPLSSLDSIVDYLAVKGLINSMQRMMLNTFDYTLLPLTADGRQYLQIKNPGKLFWCEFLPSLDPRAEKWGLFENEYQFVVELAYDYIGYANIEIQAQASMLGVGKEAANLLSHWEKKVEDLIKEFEEGSLINYMG